MPAHFWCPLNIWNVTDWGLLKFLLSCDNYTEHYSNDTVCPVSRSVHRVSQNIILKYLRASVPCTPRDNISSMLSLSIYVCVYDHSLYNTSSFKKWRLPPQVWKSLGLWECQSSPLARANNKLLIVFQLGSHHQECPVWVFGNPGDNWTFHNTRIVRRLSISQQSGQSGSTQRGWKVFNLVSIWQRLALHRAPALLSVSGPNVGWRQR